MRRILRHLAGLFRISLIRPGTLADLLFQPPADVMVRAWFYADQRSAR